MCGSSTDLSGLDRKPWDAPTSASRPGKTGVSCCSCFSVGDEDLNGDLHIHRLHHLLMVDRMPSKCKALGSIP